MEFVHNFTPSDFQAKNFTPLISPNFNSFSKKKHKKRENGEIYTAGQKFYTAAGTDGTDKFQLWLHCIILMQEDDHMQNWVTACHGRWQLYDHNAMHSNTESQKRIFEIKLWRKEK